MGLPSFALCLVGCGGASLFDHRAACTRQASLSKLVVYFGVYYYIKCNEALDNSWNVSTGLLSSANST